MTTSAMAQKLNAQMNLEFRASHLYISLSNWCMERNQPGMGVFLRIQAQKCVTHMMRVFEYIKASGRHPVIKAENMPNDSVACLDEALRQILENQALRVYELECLAEEAKMNTDMSTLNLLKNIHAEQKDNSEELKKHLDMYSSKPISLTC